MRCAAVTLAVAAALYACSSGRGTSEPRPQRNLITAEEIAELNVNYAYQAVQQLRPQWLTPRPSRSTTDPTPVVPVVFLDRNFLGDLNQLRTIVLSNVQEIRYLEPGEAVMRYGTQYSTGIIQVITR